MKSGDVCRRCRSGILGVYRTRRTGELCCRYLKCPKCGANETSVVPSDTIRRRQKLLPK